MLGTCLYNGAHFSPIITRQLAWSGDNVPIWSIRLPRNDSGASILAVNCGERQSWQSILAVNCGTVAFFHTHKLLGRKKVKILPTTICYLKLAGAPNYSLYRTSWC